MNEDYGGKKIWKWPMFVGVESSDKICHMTVHTRKRRREAGLRAGPPAGLVKSVDAGDVEKRTGG